MKFLLFLTQNVSESGCIGSCDGQIKTWRGVAGFPKLFQDKKREHGKFEVSRYFAAYLLVYRRVPDKEEQSKSKVIESSITHY